MDAEFGSHLQMLVDEYVAQGMDRAAAEAQASREFGAVALAKDECRDARGVSVLDDLAQDTRYALRSCRRNPGFTAVAVLTLALGIAANTALFSVVNAVLLRPLPFPDAERLVRYPLPYGLPRQVFTVVGIMGDDFRFPSEQTAFWIPLNVERAGGSANIARLGDGVSREVAEEEVNSMLQGRRGENGPADGATPRFEVVGLQDELVASVRPVLRILLVAAALVLLIVCSNVANLLLTRATVRGREVSLRMALGAGRGRIIRQMMAEGTVLAVFGGVIGTVLALGGVQVLRVLFESLRGHVNIRQVGVDVGRVATFPRVEEIGIDATTLAFTAGVCLMAGVVFGLAPALRTAASSVANALREGSASDAFGFGLFRHHATRSVLVIGQVALAVTLLVGGSLVVRSFVRLITTDAGFDPSNVLTFQLRLPKTYANRQVRQMSDQLVERAASLPGVRGAAYGILPLVSRLAYTPLLTSPSEQLPPPPAAQRNGESFYTPEYPELRLVSRDYLRVMGMRILAGQGFDAVGSGHSRGIIINETLARRRFSGQAVGREVYFGADAPWQIMGVVADVRQQGLDVEPSPQVFVDFGRWDRFIDIADDPGYYAVKTDGPPSPALLASLRDIVGQLDRQAMLDNVVTMTQLVNSSVARPRLYATVLGLFAAIAVMLAAVGVYGVMAYAVAQSTREIGVRMALGAREVVGLVIGRAAVLTGIGMALGFAGAIAVNRLLQGMIFGLPPHGLSTYIGVAAGFSAVALIAAYVPAVRATRVSPLIALRAE
jgi:putative ABC transport system permease protein